MRLQTGLPEFLAKQSAVLSAVDSPFTTLRSVQGVVPAEQAKEAFTPFTFNENVSVADVMFGLNVFVLETIAPFPSLRYSYDAEPETVMPPENVAGDVTNEQ